MNTVDLSLKMNRFVQWLDGRCASASFVRRRFDGPPFGNCYVTIDPGRQATFASGNMNRVYLCGLEAGMDQDSIRRLIDLFRSEGIGRFFVWLSPGPDMDIVRGWIEASGLSRIRWTGYPTLCRSDRAPVHCNTDLSIREVGIEDIAAARDELGDTLWPDYVRTAGQPDFYHYMAFDGRRPVAIAALCVFEDIAYLMAAATAERDRRRGAQQALIARRIERAEQIGCVVQVSETLYMLEHSYRNLQRAGFREVYEKEVYEWVA
jgi:GNAT superfamily N-acetyltransferase